MRHHLLLALAGFAAACASQPATGAPAAAKDLQAVYAHLHANPELSFREQQTSAFLAAEMKRLGFDVTQGVGSDFVRRKALAQAGVVDKGVGGYGLVAVLRNGEGPTVMIRADMDALPVPERTGLPFASTRRATGWLGGAESEVMHACGHDVHMTVWIGAARELVARRAEWKGTLVMIAQPAEEVGLGALSLLDGGLFRDFPRPDYNLAFHVSADLPAGKIAFTPGFSNANVDSVDIKVRGKGGHGAYPHDTIDPIVVAARIVGALQTLVSREVDPLDAGVVTVGAINGGAKHNIIPDEVTLLLTVRSFEDATRKRLLDGIARIAKAEAMAAGLEGDLAPEVKLKDEFTPSLYNEPGLATRVRSVTETVLGAENVVTGRPTMGGEDFARYGRDEPKIPSLMMALGAVEPQVWAAAQLPGAPGLPSLHSSKFAPDVARAIPTGVTVMTAAVLDLFKPAP